MGYKVVYPDGRESTDNGAPLFLTYREARAEVRAAGGGTVHRIIKRS